MRKCTFWHVGQMKIQISLHIHSLIRVFLVHMKKLCILGYPKCTQGRFRSETSLNAHVWCYVIRHCGSSWENYPRIIIDSSLTRFFIKQIKRKIYQRNSCASCWAYPLNQGIDCHTARRKAWGLTWAHFPDHNTRNSPCNSPLNDLELKIKIIISELTLVLLNPHRPYLCKQCSSRSVGFWRRKGMIWICSLSFSMWICINSLDQVLWLADN